MKKFIVLAMVAVALIIFNGCQKDELVLIDEQPQVVVKPDVYVENGYLAFKNMEAVDSVIQILSKMTTTEKENWESKMGFKSARAEFEKLFNEYDKLESYEAFLAFKDMNKSNLKFNESDPNDCSIDYPFATRYFTPVLNTKGVYKVGRTIIKYSLDNQIAILDGDINKLNNFNNSGVNQLKYGLIRNNISSIHNFPEDNPNGDYTNPWHRKPNISDRKLKNELYFETYIYYFEDRWENNQWVPYYENGLRVYLNQRGQKVSWGNWRDYATEYSLKEIRFQVGSFTEVQDGRTHISAEVNPSASFNLHKEFYITNNPNANYLPLPANVNFVAQTSFRGFGFNTTDYYPIENPENYTFSGGYTYPSSGWGW